MVSSEQKDIGKRIGAVIMGKHVKSGGVGGHHLWSGWIVLLASAAHRRIFH